jgi:hypothetical protein
VTAPGDQIPALTAEYDVGRPVGTVRGTARVLVRPADHQAGAILRLRRFLAHPSLLRYRDLARDGSALGPERDAVTLSSDDPRVIDCGVDLPLGAVSREYRLEWELNPDDHPAIGVANEEMLLFRAHLLGRGEDGAETIWEQQLIRVRWDPTEDVDTAFDRWCTSASTPEPVREALKALLDAEVQKPRVCEGCHARNELDLFLARDRVWERTAEPELEELRRLFVLRELIGPSRVASTGTLMTRHDHDEDLSAPLAAARERHAARIVEYAPPETKPLPAEWWESG